MEGLFLGRRRFGTNIRCFVLDTRTKLIDKIFLVNNGVATEIQTTSLQKIEHKYLNLSSRNSLSLSSAPEGNLNLDLESFLLLLPRVPKGKQRPKDQGIVNDTIISEFNAIHPRVWLWMLLIQWLEEVTR